MAKLDPGRHGQVRPWAPGISSTLGARDKFDPGRHGQVRPWAPWLGSTQVAMAKFDGVERRHAAMPRRPGAVTIRRVKPPAAIDYWPAACRYRFWFLTARNVRILRACFESSCGLFAQGRGVALMVEDEDGAEEATASLENPLGCAERPCTSAQKTYPERTQGIQETQTDPTNANSIGAVSRRALSRTAFRPPVAAQKKNARRTQIHVRVEFANCTGRLATSASGRLATPVSGRFTTSTSGRLCAWIPGWRRKEPEPPAW